MPGAESSDAMTTTYDELCSRWTRLYRFQHLQSIAGWDQAAMMPSKGHTARASAMAEMEGLLHGLRTDPKLADLLQRAAGEDLAPFARANLREMRREWLGSNALPQALVEALSL